MIGDRASSIEPEMRSPKRAKNMASVGHLFLEFFVITSVTVPVLWLVANLASCGPASIRYAKIKAMDSYLSSAGHKAQRVSCVPDGEGVCGRRKSGGFADFYACSVYGSTGRTDLCCDGDARLLNEGCFETSGGMKR